MAQSPFFDKFKSKQVEQLSNSETGRIYARRKTDVEPVFGMMKAYLGFKRYHVRGIEKVRRETGILIMAMNMIKLTVQRRLRYLKQKKNADENENQERFGFHQRYFIFKGQLCHSLFFRN